MNTFKKIAKIYGYISLGIIVLTELIYFLFIINY